MSRSSENFSGGFLQGLGRMIAVNKQRQKEEDYNKQVLDLKIKENKAKIERDHIEALQNAKFGDALNQGLAPPVARDSLTAGSAPGTMSLQDVLASVGGINMPMTGTPDNGLRGTLPIDPNSGLEETLMSPDMLTAAARTGKTSELQTMVDMVKARQEAKKPTAQLKDVLAQQLLDQFQGGASNSAGAVSGDAMMLPGGVQVFPEAALKFASTGKIQDLISETSGAPTRSPDGRNYIWRNRQGRVMATAPAPQKISQPIDIPGQALRGFVDEFGNPLTDENGRPRLVPRVVRGVGTEVGDPHGGPNRKIVRTTELSIDATPDEVLEAFRSGDVIFDDFEPKSTDIGQGSRQSSSDGTMKEMKSFQRQAILMNDVMDIYRRNPGYFGTRGAIKTKFKLDIEDMVLGFLNGDDPRVLEDPVMKEIASAYAKLATVMNAVVKDQSGAAVSTQEMQRMKLQVPSPGDNVNRFLGKMKTFMEDLQVRGRAVNDVNLSQQRFVFPEDFIPKFNFNPETDTFNVQIDMDQINRLPPEKRKRALEIINKGKSGSQ